MLQQRVKILYAYILILLVASGLIFQADSQNTTAVSNTTQASQDLSVSKEAPKVSLQNPITTNTTAVIPEIPKTELAAGLSFDRWAITFQCPGEWKEWEAEKSVYAKQSLNEQLKPFNIEMLGFTMLMSPNEDAALLISKSERASPVIIEDLVKERENVYKDAKAAGDVTNVNQLEKTSINDKGALIEDVERATGGRAISMKIISGKKVFEISVVAKDKNDFDKYRPVFEAIIKTVKISE